MKASVIFSLAVSALVFASGCSGYHSSMNSQHNETGLNNPALQPTEGRILGVLEVLNKNEITTAKLAQHKATEPEVRGYADLMYRQHTSNLQEVKSLSHRLGITPQKGPIALSLQQKGNMELSRLNRLNKIAFNKAYLDAMISDHRAALKLVDGLISQSTNTYVKKDLQLTRGHIAMHLQTALNIRHNLYH